MSLSICFSLCSSLYMGLSICLFSLCIFLFSPLFLNCIKDAIEVIVDYKLLEMLWILWTMWRLFPASFL